MAMITVIERDGPANEMQKLLLEVAEGRHLGVPEAGRAFQIIMMGGSTPAQTAAFLMGLHINKETVEEITGAAMALRNKAKKLAVPEEFRPRILDTCGTGGDKKGTYNISTASAFVVAGCGVPVAKHGNMAISSKSGSADVLKALGVNIEAEDSVMLKALLEAHICFLMAPRFHAAMREVAPIRRELGFRTIFNTLGPLINPAMPERQVLGVYAKELVEPLARVLDRLGCKHAWVVHGADGMDELTTMDENHVAMLDNGEVTNFIIKPEDYGIARPEDPNALKGGEAMVNAQALRYVLQGHGKEDKDKLRPYRDIVLFNAAAALVVAGKAADIKQGLGLAAQSVDSGRAKMALDRLVEITNS